MLTSAAGATGRWTLKTIHAVLAVCRLVTGTFYWMIAAPLTGQGLRARSTLDHYVDYAARSLPVVALISFLIGAIMAMQSSYQLARFGAVQFVAHLVGIAALRELAPLMAAILLAGRSGSAITAEIGAMKVSEELDALEVMGINSIKFLVVPKFLAMVLALPSLTAAAMVIMIAGGFALSVTALQMDPWNYLAQTASALHIRDFATGMVKSVFFAVAICWVGVYRGFQVEGGAESVGKQTTSSVVTAIFFIILIDLVFTALFFSM